MFDTYLPHASSSTWEIMTHIALHCAVVTWLFLEGRISALMLLPIVSSNQLSVLSQQQCRLRQTAMRQGCQKLRGS